MCLEGGIALFLNLSDVKVRHKETRFNTWNLQENVENKLQNVFQPLRTSAL